MSEEIEKPNPKPTHETKEGTEKKGADTGKFNRPAPWPSVPKPIIDNIRRPETPKDDKKD